MRPVAFFDIDGTIFRSSLFLELVEACIRTGVFPQNVREQYVVEYEAWRNREGSYEAYISAVIAVFNNHIRGVHYGVFADMGRMVVETQGKHTYRYTRDLLRDLKGKGYFLVAISQSPKTILDAFCETLGFHKVYGRMYELGPRDLLTGAVMEESLIANKAHVVARVLEREGCTTEGSIGVGDTEGDIPFLEMVETPICFNPNMNLYTHAKTHKWPIVVERKDVIYTI